MRQENLFVRWKLFILCVIGLALAGQVVFDKSSFKDGLSGEIKSASGKAKAGGQHTVPTAPSPDLAWRRGIASSNMYAAADSTLGIDPVVASAALRADYLCNEVARLDRRSDSVTSQQGFVPIAEYLKLDCSAAYSAPLSPEDAYDLAALAAEGGDVQAQLKFRSYGAAKVEDERFALDPEVIADYREKTFRYLEMAVSQGEPGALFVLSGLYAGDFAPDADPVKAYAYASAYRAASMKPQADRLVQVTREQLSLDQIAAGNTLANQILQQQKGVLR